MSKLDEYSAKYACAKCERRDGILQVTLHTNEDSLILSHSVHRDLGYLFQDIAEDDGNKVMILTGAGRTFCSKVDVASFSFNDRKPTPPEWYMRIHRHGRRMLNQFLEIDIPTISAINGPVLSHSELPVLADVVLASEDAVFQDATHFITGGTPPGDGMNLVWMQLLGFNRGRYFLLTGEKLSAVRAHELGVVGEVLPKGKVLSRAWELAKTWVAYPKAGLVGTRRSLISEWKRLLALPLDSSLLEEGMHVLATMPMGSDAPAIVDLMGGDK